MEKLRVTSKEKEEFLKAIRDELYMGNYNSVLKNFSIKEIIEEFSEIPKDVEKPTLNITAEAYVKMLELIRQSSVEISWHALVEKQSSGSFYLYDILVFPQINSATSTTTDDEDFAKWQMELIANKEFPYEDLRCHGHSHVNMNVFSSGIDDQYQHDLIAKVEDGDYYIFLIMNKKMEICAFIYDFDKQIMFETKDINIKIVGTHTDDIIDWAKETIKEKCVTERPATTYQYGINRRQPYYQPEEENNFFGTKTKPLGIGRNRK